MSPLQRGDYKHGGDRYIKSVQEYHSLSQAMFIAALTQSLVFSHRVPRNRSSSNSLLPLISGLLRVPNEISLNTYKCYLQGGLYCQEFPITSPSTTTATTTVSTVTSTTTYHQDQHHCYSNQHQHPPWLPGSETVCLENI